MSTEGWIGVDLDGTLAEYHGWVGVLHIGDPIPAMVERVKKWHAAGVKVKIFTARMAGGREVTTVVNAVNDWCLEHLGFTLEVTNIKDFGMYELWDDRAVTVELNTGKIICHPYGQEDTP